MAPQESDDKNHSANRQAQKNELVPHLPQLPFKTGFRRLGLTQEKLETAHLCVSPCGNDHSQPFPARHEGSHENHVHSIRKGNAFSSQGPCSFQHRHALAGEHRLVDAEVGSFQQPAISGHIGARLEQQEIPWHEVFSGDLDHQAVAHHFGSGMDHVFERADRLLRSAFRGIADHGVCHHHARDDYGIQKTPGEYRNTCSRSEQKNRKGFELAEKDVPLRARLRLGENIGAEALKALIHDLGGKTTVLIRPPIIERSLRFYQMPGLRFLLFQGRNELAELFP